MSKFCRESEGFIRRLHEVMLAAAPTAGSNLWAGLNEPSRENVQRLLNRDSESMPLSLFLYLINWVDGQGGSLGPLLFGPADKRAPDSASFRDLREGDPPQVHPELRHIPSGGAKPMMLGASVFKPLVSEGRKIVIEIRIDP